VRTLLGLESPTSGSVHLANRLFSPAPSSAQHSQRHLIQAVFQDPYGSFDPRHSVARILAEPLSLLSETPTGTARHERIVEHLEAVGLSADDANKFPHQFSGGQRQRIAIARALMVDPAIVLLDEATSALDVSVRAQILDLLIQLSRDRNIAYLFVSHDLDIVRAVTDRVLIMHEGKIIEDGLTSEIFANPKHTYTRSLMGAKATLKQVLEQRAKEAT